MFDPHYGLARNHYLYNISQITSFDGIMNVIGTWACHVDHFFSYPRYICCVISTSRSQKFHRSLNHPLVLSLISILTFLSSLLSIINMSSS